MKKQKKMLWYFFIFQLFDHTKKMAKVMLRIHTFYTPFHDVLFLLGILLSTILTSLRLENVISVKYSFLFIPALISLFGFLVSSNFYWSE